MLLKLVLPFFDRAAECGSIAKWHKKEGDWVNYGDDILDIQIEEAKVFIERVDPGSILGPSGPDANTSNQSDTVSSDRFDWRMRLTSSDMGVLRRITKGEGDHWEIGDTLAIITTEEEESAEASEAELEETSSFRVVVNATEDE